MALAGDEKRIRALFSELSFEDQTCAPQFETLWSRAENSLSIAPAQVRRLSSSALTFALAALAFVVIGVLAVWSWSASTKSPDHNAVNVNVVPQITPPLPTPAERDATGPASATERSRPHRRRKKSSDRRRTTDRAAAEAALLSRWQSPTNILMASPAGIVFNSLPQLNESAEELKQFLPKNEAMKESNQ